MTIASEITRIQGAKSDIRQAIIDKGVSVSADLTIDNYACCINDIPTGGGGKLVDVMVVAGGGAGGHGWCLYCAGGGGGAGGYIQEKKHYISEDSYCIVVGAGGTKGVPGTNGGDSCFGSDIVMAGGGRGNGGNGGSGGGGVFYGCSSNPYGYYGGCVVSCGKIGGHSGGTTSYAPCALCGVGGGGGGAGGGGYGNLSVGVDQNNTILRCGGYGGLGVSNNFAGVSRCYAGGGGGGGYNTYGQPGCCGGGNGGACRGGAGCNATTYGSGGGGGGRPTSGSTCGGNGCQGIVVVRYPTDGSYGINSATGGNTCRTCTISGVEYCIHEFTSNGTFCITS